MTANLIIVIISMKVAVTLFAATLVLCNSQIRRDQAGFLAVFLGLYALINFNELFKILGGYFIYPHFLGVLFPIKLLLAPAIYFYARAITSEQFNWLSKKDYTALIAPLLAYLIAIPFFILPANEKIALMSEATRDKELYERAILGSQIGLTLFLVVSLAYLNVAYRLFRQHTQRLRDLFSRIDNKSVNWLRWILLILATGWSSYAVSEIWGLIGGRPNSIYMFYQLFECSWIVIIAFFGLQQQSVYPAIKQVSESEQTDRYVNSSLTEEQLNDFAVRLKNAMVDKELYLETELSLRDLSKTIEVRENNISETFNRHFSQNFFDFVNSYRVQKACELLQQSDMNVLTIALEVGFNSRSTFNAAFKKHTGETPSQFRKNKTLLIK
jgi:AraC-like DNA-binding protein